MPPPPDGRLARSPARATPPPGSVGTCSTRLAGLDDKTLETILGMMAITGKVETGRQEPDGTHFTIIVYRPKDALTIRSVTA